MEQNEEDETSYATNVEPRFQTVNPYSSKWPRNSEGSMAVLPDGKWLLAWTAFYGGFRDYSPAHIMAKWSQDKGETWSQPFILKENDGKCNVMSVSLVTLSDGSIGFYHFRKDRAWPNQDGRPFFSKSTDGGQTFCPEIMITDKTIGACNGRLLQLSTGRLLLPIAYSDDDGGSWRLSHCARPLSEPAAFEARDGRVILIWRTKLGTLYTSESTDGGETYSDPYDTGLEAAASPCAVGRIPKTDDLLLVWNQARPLSPGGMLPRTPLTTAVSRDDGETWENIKNIEPDTSFTYMYPSLAFDGDLALILYSQGEVDSVEKFKTNWNNTSLKLATVPNEWFYS